MGCARICNVLHGLKPVLLMLAYQVMSAGLTILFKLVANDGMSLTVFTAYRLLFASVFAIPLALLVERNKRPKMTWSVLVQAFFCGLLGIAMAQNLYVMSIALVSATYAVAISNVVPAITFVMAVCFRLEKLALRTIPGAAKVSGTAVAMGGAMVFTFYKGITINLWSLHPHLMHAHNRLRSSVHAHGSSDQALGSVFAVVSCLGSSSWLIIQGKMSTTYPCPLSAAALITLMATIQCLVFALCIERDWTQWKLGFNIRLLAVSYSGILVSGIGIALAIWCVNMRGPLFVASFSPAALLLVAIFGSLLLEEKLYLGSVLGAVLIICGLYLVLWGNSREMQTRNRVEPVLQTPRPSEARSTEIIETSLVIISENNSNIKTDGRRS